MSFQFLSYCFTPGLCFSCLVEVFARVSSLLLSSPRFLLPLLIRIPQYTPGSPNVTLLAEAGEQSFIKGARGSWVCVEVWEGKRGCNWINLSAWTARLWPALHVSVGGSALSIWTGRGWLSLASLPVAHTNNAVSAHPVPVTVPGRGVHQFPALILKQ